MAVAASVVGHAHRLPASRRREGHRRRHRVLGEGTSRDLLVQRLGLYERAIRSASWPRRSSEQATSCCWPTPSIPDWSGAKSCNRIGRRRPSGWARRLNNARSSRCPTTDSPRRQRGLDTTSSPSIATVPPDAFPHSYVRARDSCHRSGWRRRSWRPASVRKTSCSRTAPFALATAISRSCAFGSPMPSTLRNTTTRTRCSSTIARRSRRGAWRSYPTYEVRHLLQSEAQLLGGETPAVDPQLFKNKVVFVGLTASGLLDMFQTPFGRGVMPGIQLHASVADSVLSNQFMRPAPHVVGA